MCMLPELTKSGDANRSAKHNSKYSFAIHLRMAIMNDQVLNMQH